MPLSVSTVWIRYGSDQGLKEACGSSHVGLADQLREDELRGAVDGHEEIAIAFCGPHLGQIDMEVADGAAVELLAWSLVAGNFRQTADAVTLQTAV